VFSALEKFDIINLLPITGILDLSFTNLALYLIFVGLTIVGLFYYVSNNLRVVPKFAQMLTEMLMSFIFDIVDKQIGKEKGSLYFPFIFVLFLFILFSNLFGMLPFGFAPTGHLAVTFFFSITIWVMCIVVGFHYQGLHFLKIFVPNVPPYLLPLLVVIEIVSYVMRVVSLAVRLAANITAGHVLLFTLSGFALQLSKFDLFLGLIPALLTLFILALELGVAFLQAYVFVTLTCIYLNDSVNGPAH
jgi:F-type H+-transporting ATPase subunit a